MDRNQMDKEPNKGWKSQCSAIMKHCRQTERILGPILRAQSLEKENDIEEDSESEKPKGKTKKVKKSKKPAIDTYCAICDRQFSKYAITRHRKTHEPKEKQRLEERSESDLVSQYDLEAVITGKPKNKQKKKIQKKEKEEPLWRFNPLFPWETQYAGQVTCLHCHLDIPYMAYHLYTCHKDLFRLVPIGDQIKCHLCPTFLSRKNFGRHLRQIHHLNIHGTQVSALAKEILKNKQNSPPNYLAMEYNAMHNQGISFRNKQIVLNSSSESIWERYTLNYPRNCLIILCLYYRLAVLFSPRITLNDLRYAYQRVSYELGDPAISTYSAIKPTLGLTFDIAMEFLFDARFLNKSVKWLDQQYEENLYASSLQQIAQDLEDMQELQRDIAQEENQQRLIELKTSLRALKKETADWRQIQPQRFCKLDEMKDVQDSQPQRLFASQRKNLKAIIRQNVQKQRAQSRHKHNPCEPDDFYVLKGRFYEGLVSYLKMAPMVYGYMTMYVPKLPPLKYKFNSLLFQTSLSPQLSDFVVPPTMRRSLSYVETLVLAAKRKEEEQQ